MTRIKHEQINESIAETVFRWPRIHDVREDIVDDLVLRPSITCCVRDALTRPPPSFIAVSAYIVVLFCSERPTSAVSSGAGTSFFKEYLK